MAKTTSTAFRPLTGIYEPSAIQQLVDGRFLVAEDEQQQPFSLVSINRLDEMDSRPLTQNAKNETGRVRKLNDLEGLTADQAGYIYAITSHSRNSEGQEKKSRNQLLRFRIEDNKMTGPQVCNELKSALVSTFSELAAADNECNSKSDRGMNIEALEISPDQKTLLIGFRSPLLDDCALIAIVENPAQIFENNASPVLSSTLYKLDLGGNGLRGMAYIATLSGYLIIAGPVDGAPMKSQLWFWNGQGNTAPHRVCARGIKDFARAEGLCSAVLNDQQKIMIVSDDGSRKKNRHGQFMLIDADALEPE